MPDKPVELTKPVLDEPPPVLGTWKRVYVFVLCWLAVVIALFYTFSRSFAP
jgi:hypothetical protein